ncbi:MAG TPA: DNA-binding domain-containing protein [Stenotrophomonas sp.]
MSTPSVELAQLQDALQGWLQFGSDRMHGHIFAHDDDERGHRLRLYADAYRLRLLEVLGQDYPALRTMIGASTFDALATRYVAVHPSRNPSLRWLGRHLADWLRAEDQPAAFSAVAQFEWAQGEVFDAADTPPIDATPLQALAPSQWPALRFTLAPALRQLEAVGNAAAIVTAAAEGQSLPAWSALPDEHWLLWRQDYIVHWRALPTDEAAALSAVAGGACFAEICTVLPAEQPALRAASLLKRWLADGLIAGLRTQNPSV